MPPCGGGMEFTMSQDQEMQNNRQDNDKLEAGDVVAASPALRWLDNFWYHHKWAVIITVFFLVVLIVCVLQMSSRVQYDFNVIFVGNGGNITGTDSSTATFHIRTDHDNSATRTDKGSFSNKVKLRLEVTPDSMCLYTDGQLYMTITYDGTEFFDGTKSTKMTYNGADVQLGLVTCYGDTSFSNVVIK